MSAEDVKKNLLSLPWVKPRYGQPVRCDGVKWGSVPMKDVPLASNGLLPEDHRARCKRHGDYVFKATKRRRKWEWLARSGSYCAMHLSMQIEDYPPEKRRADAWFDKNGWWRNGVFGFHGIGKVEDTE